MYFFFSSLTGVLISIMIVFNGLLSEQYGAYSATIIVHITGVLLIAVLLLCKREKPMFHRRIWFLYFGGGIGVITNVLNNLAFGRISVSAILALGLLGQSIAGLVIDQYGLANLPRHSFHKSKVPGLVLILAGILAMMTHFELLPVLLSFFAGISIVASRSMNAIVSEQSNIRISTFYNYVVGLLVSIPAFYLLGREESAGWVSPASVDFYLYLGGILGVGVILLSNLTVTKISAVYLSMLVFIGQVFTGVVIDAVFAQAFAMRNIIGGILVTAGLAANLLSDRSIANKRKAMIS